MCVCIFSFFYTKLHREENKNQTQLIPHFQHRGCLWYDVAKSQRNNSHGHQWPGSPGIFRIETKSKKVADGISRDVTKIKKWDT